MISPRRPRRATCVLIALCSIAVIALGCKSEETAKLPPDFLKTAKKLYSERDEEKIIRHFFNDRRGGFFVDVGCAEWSFGSTTLYLEHHLGWTGIGIDARGDLRASYEEHRPGTRFFNYLVTDHAGTQDTFYRAAGISSTDREHVKSFPLPAGFEPEEVKVPSSTLNQILDQNGVKKIDFLSMDIELGEPAALAGLDIERFKPELVCIEAGNATVRAAIEPYFAQHGYRRIEEYIPLDYANWYYTPKQ